MKDILGSAYAVLALKCPSLLSFEKTLSDPIYESNMKNLFRVEQVPSDTCMRETIDEIDPSELRPSFKAIFNSVQRGKALESYKFIANSYLVALDGTGYFSSTKVNCPQCLTKKSKKTREVTYHHQMVGAVIIHPEDKVVIPLCPEPIVKKDGQSKNDCERNAVKRWLKSFRKDHPKLKVIITEDGLSSNAPHIKDLKESNCSFILGAKPGDHKFLFEQVHLLASQVQKHEIREGYTRHEFTFINDIPINESNEETKVNFLDYREISSKGVKVFSWVTDIELKKTNVYSIMRGGRARWKIENETFNTLKNQGYHFEHNYGHGYKNLSVNFAFLMFLAFAVDQAQQACCKVFQAAKQRAGTYRKLWGLIQYSFNMIIVDDWISLLEVVAGNKKLTYSDSS
jgi:hypothetical protein